jgi:hypothetical protein
MTFKINMSIFKSTKPGSKVDFSGMMNIKPEELDALCAFVLSQPVDQYGSVQVPVSGWKRVSEKVGAYISALAEPPRDWVPPATAQSAAESLAKATDGVVTEIIEADLF